MAAETLRLVDVYARLRRAIRDAGNASAWAMRHRISPQYVSDVLHARREPGDLILSALGLVRVVTYAEKGKKKEAQDG